MAVLNRVARVAFQARIDMVTVDPVPRVSLPSDDLPAAVDSVPRVAGGSVDGPFIDPVTGIHHPARVSRGVRPSRPPPHWARVYGKDDRKYLTLQAGKGRFV